MKTPEKPRNEATPLRVRRPEIVSLALPPTSKITSAHLHRLAIVYVRQSSRRQVRDNRESTDRQMGDRYSLTRWELQGPGHHPL